LRTERPGDRANIRLRKTQSLRQHCTIGAHAPSRPIIIPLFPEYRAAATRPSTIRNTARKSPADDREIEPLSGWNIPIPRTIQL
jgi:hypothetical protein